MTLHLHTAERTDALAAALADLLVTPLPDPFAREVVVVPARGVERWLTQRLSHRLGVGSLGVGSGVDTGSDGVCAGIDFVSPHSLVTLLLEKDVEDPWDPDRLAWPLLGVIDDVMGTAGFEDLTVHLGGGDPADDRSARRYAVARRLAGLFSSYAVQRPALISQWRSGEDTDGLGGPLDDDLRWQAALWRRLVDTIAVPAPDLRHEKTLARLRAGGEGLDLPPRLSLFGHTRLPETEVALLRALAEVREVHLWLPQASPVLWKALTPSAREGQVPRAADDSVTLVAHPLLSSLGRDSRELRRTLGVLTDQHAPAVSSPPDTLLGWLQHDLRDNLAPDAAARATRVGSDDSVQVHACHGAARQIDVLREVLVGLLEDDPTLEPRDVLVMCPDIETFAPLISAAFGMADVAGDGVGHPGHQLRVRLADRSLVATNPLLAVASQLVELVHGRMSATQVLDIVGAAPVRERFGFGDDELERLTHWVSLAGIRWGYDAAHREVFGLGSVSANTWLLGVRRVLLGAAMSGLDHRQVSRTVPVDDVSDGDLDLVGRLAEFLDRLRVFLEAAESATTVTDWTTALGDAVHRLTSTPPDEVWQVAQFDREMSRIAAGAGDGDGEGDGTTLLRQADVRALLQHRLRGRPTRSNFRTGTLTVCTMVPMRSVPHRVVCLVGLDDGAFPRVSTVDGDDVLSRRPRTGERDLRAEDRQLFLDAIIAAGDKLVITYTGRGEHTGSARPPSVPLGELLDALDRTGAAEMRDHVVTHHPLQPFDEANFVAGSLRGKRAFTFDRFALAGAAAARGERAPVEVLVPDPLPAPDPAPSEISLVDLQDFFAHPVRGFFRRLRIAKPFDADEVKDAIPISLDGLEKWAIGDLIAAEVLGGADAIAVNEALKVSGSLPPGPLGEGVLDDIVQVAKPLVMQALALRRGPRRVLDVDIDLDGRRIFGTVGDIWGNQLVAVSFSNLGAKHRLAAWINAVVLAAGLPDENWTAHTIGKHRSGGQMQLIAPLAQHQAQEWLRELVALYDAGQREPLPMPIRTSLAWAEESRRVRAGNDGYPDTKGRNEWESPRFNDSGFPKEDADAWHVRAFGESADYDLLAAPARSGESGPHRLGHYAWRLWSPLIDSGNEQIRGL